MEKFYRFFKLKGEPPITEFSALQLGTSHFFNHEKARRDFDYSPIVSNRQGLEKLIYWLKATRQVPT
jgi:nucleoside-diphosphate-sugar epimerase